MLLLDGFKSTHLQLQKNYRSHKSAVWLADIICRVAGVIRLTCLTKRP